MASTIYIYRLTVNTRFFIYFLLLSDEGQMLEILDHTIRIGSTPTFLYFDLYLYSAYAAHHVYFNLSISLKNNNKLLAVSVSAVHQLFYAYFDLDQNRFLFENLQLK